MKDPQISVGQGIPDAAYSSDLRVGNILASAT